MTVRRKRIVRGTRAITLAAPAKVNLTLEVVARLPNGYHAIRSVMARMPHLADVVRVEVRDGPNGVRIRTNSTEIPIDGGNICHRAALAYLHHAGTTAQVDIDIRKTIPVAAGLGGGSSDAAAVLTALNDHFDRPVSPRQLAAIGASLGKDLPFFLGGASVSRVWGMGESVRPIASLPRSHLLIVNPRIAISTKAAYEALSGALWFMQRSARVDRTRRMASAIAARDIAAMGAALYNDFELVAERAHPILKEVKQSLLAFGAQGALMSGSGPTVFGLFAAPTTLANARTALRSRYPGFFVERG
jgi:4-diphosphocytidyl-2-C-methyl-D-erythritol kinase